jgi:ribonucleoside-diphosphate reductase alpha chain
MSTYGPRNLFSDRLHAEKYRQPGESFEDAMRRIAKGLADSPEHEEAFFNIIADMRFLPAGRVQSAIGASKQVTAFNCFVAPDIADAFVNSDDCLEDSIMDVALKACKTMRMGGGIGYNFSTLRPRGAEIKKLRSSSSGPIAFMDIFDAICRSVSSSGHRRGAQMGVLNIDHPDIEEFITIKTDLTKLTGFNISVGVTDEFMACLKEGKPFELKFNGEVYKTVDPAYLWDLLMRTTYDYAEPGVLFLDRINDFNNLYYCEKINAVNPCGEIPLAPNGACLLGSFNLVKYVKTCDETNSRRFLWIKFMEDIRVVIRAMDNVIDRTIYPLPEQERKAKSTRRMGIGITGLANAVELLGHPYGTPEFIATTREILTILRDNAYITSAFLAEEKGVFPDYDVDKYLEGKFIKTLPERIQNLIRRYGMRNSHLTAIAPTGTISLAADNISSGIEPVFSYEGERLVNMPEGQIKVKVNDYAFANFTDGRNGGFKGRKSTEVSIDEHLAVLSLCSELVDNAVSKTLNLDSSTKMDAFKKIYETAYYSGCKGCTTFNKDGKRFGILIDNDAQPDSEAGEAGGACVYDPETGIRSCDK